ncbi:MAG: c-type cytochrome [Sulfurimonas sp.]|nr:c-type cytochrome [Sulfurimonas sp.]
MKIALSVLTSLVVLVFLVACSSDEKAASKVVEAPMEVVVEEKLEVIDAPALKTLVEEATTDIVESVIIDTKIDAKLLYATCISCHGANGEKAALGKSEVIQGWDTQRTIDALNGYSDETYGGAFKVMMKAQSDKLDETQKKAIAEYISNL